MGVDIQRGRRLTVSEQSCDRADVRAAGDEQACCRVAQAVNVQVRRQVVCFEDFLEAPCEGRGRHRELHALSAEHIVIFGLLASVVKLCFYCAEGFVFAEQTFHFGGEVHIPVARFRFRGFHDDLVAGRFDRVSADVDAALGVVDVLPLECAAFAAPHSGRDDELEVGFVQDAHGLQRLNQLFHRFIVRDLFLFLLSCVLVSAPRGIVIKIAALHRVGEDAAQTAVDTFYRRFGERLSCRFIFLFPQLCVQAAEVFRPQIDQLVAAEIRFEAFNVLLFAHERGFCELVWRNGLQPDFCVFFQRDRPVDARVQLLAAHLEDHRLLL